MSASWEIRQPFGSAVVPDVYISTPTSRTRTARAARRTTSRGTGVGRARGTRRGRRSPGGELAPSMTRRQRAAGSAVGARRGAGRSRRTPRRRRSSDRDGVRVAQHVRELVVLVARVDEQRADAEQRAAEEGVDEVGQLGIRTATASPRPTPMRVRAPARPAREAAYVSRVRLARPGEDDGVVLGPPGGAAREDAADRRRRDPVRRRVGRPAPTSRRGALTRSPAGPGCPRGRRTRAPRSRPATSAVAPRRTICPRCITSTWSATRSACLTCCSTSSTPTLASCAAYCTASSSRLDDQRREPERELVDQQQLRLAGERPGEREHLLLAAGEQPCAPPHEGLQLGEELERPADVGRARRGGSRRPRGA